MSDKKKTQWGCQADVRLLTCPSSQALDCMHPQLLGKEPASLPQATWQMLSHNVTGRKEQRGGHEWGQPPASSCQGEEWDRGQSFTFSSK